MSEHIITREMLISTLSEVMKERDRWKKEAEISHNAVVDAGHKIRNLVAECDKRGEENGTLRQSQLGLNQAIARLQKEAVDRRHAQDLEFTRMQDELAQARKQACDCAIGPGSYWRVQNGVESLDQSPEQRIENLCKRLSEQASEIERLKRENMLLTVKLTPPFDIRTNAPSDSVDIRARTVEANAELQALNDRINNVLPMVDKLQKDLDDVTKQRDHMTNTIRMQGLRIGELQAESDKNAKAAQLAEQEVRVLRGKSEYGHALMLAAEIKQLKESQCQCVPVLEEKIKKLEAQLPEKMKTCTIRFKQCEEGHGMLTATNWVEHSCPWCKIAKLRELFDAGMHSNEMLMSNPPKNMIAYRGREILREGE